MQAENNNNNILYTVEINIKEEALN